MSEPTSFIASLIRRVREELGALFDPATPVAIGFAPQSLDVIGGLLAGHGGVRCLMPLSRCAFALAQRRSDRQVLIFDFDEYDLHRPFTLQMPIDALRSADVSELKKNLGEPGRAFAEQAVAAARTLLKRETPTTGFNLVLARQPEVERDVGVALAATAALSSALELPDTGLDVAVAHMASLWQWPGAVGVDAAARLADRITRFTSDDPASGEAVHKPDDVEMVAVPLQSPASHDSLPHLAVAARMAHHLVLEKMRAFGQQAGRELITDPMAGHIGNLTMSDYKRFFRGTLPETIRGAEFLVRCGIELPGVEGDRSYGPQFVADHLVIEANRAREWAGHLREARDCSDPAARKLSIDKAGHLMYASHKSARENCGVGSDEADRWVDAVRANEWAGLFGARLSVDGRYIALLARTDANWPGFEQRIGFESQQLGQRLRIGQRVSACRTSLQGNDDCVSHI